MPKPRRIFLWLATLIVAGACATAVRPSSEVDVVEDPGNQPAPTSTELTEMRPVDDRSRAPFPSIVRMEIRRPINRYFTSTGALISTNHILTAAHNVHSPTLNRISNGVVRAALRGDSALWAPDFTFNRRHQRVPDGYRFRHYPLDYADVRLPSHSPYQPAFRILHVDEVPPAIGDVVHVAGYPGPPPKNDTLHYAAGRVQGFDGELMHYSVATHTGVSGSPVWVERNGEFIIVGIHVTGTDTSAIARRVDTAARNQINRWLSEFP